MSNWRERLRAHGELSRDTLDPYRAAGRGVYDYVLDLDTARAEGVELPAVQAALLAGWVAFSLQVLGDEMLDADAAYDPATAHSVPPVTAEQVTEFYQPVRQWIGRARAAQASPTYRIDVPLPEILPPWVEVEPCPPAHLIAMRQAVMRLREYCEGLTAGFAPQQPHAREIVAQGLAEAAAAADYANAMWVATSGPPPAKAHEVIETNLKQATETYFYLGQVIAMPSLADAPRRVHETAPEEGNKPSFLEKMGGAYPQMTQRGSRPGGSSGMGGGFLGGLLGGAVIEEILGALGGGGSDWN